MPIKVLVVDDSALMRRLLTELLARDPALTVVGAAADPYVARDMIKALSPDVLTLDVEMPRMDGLTFLRNLMRLRPMPVVMVSTLTERGADTTLEALALGAVDFVAKPKTDVHRGLSELAAELIHKVKSAAGANVSSAVDLPPVTGPPAPLCVERASESVIAIGSSTGGTEAVSRLLHALPPVMPGIVIAQHIPAEFSRRFAQRLDGSTPHTVTEAVEGAPILPGHVYVAPGSHHLRVVRQAGRFVCALGDDDPVHHHRPSVDVLFESVARGLGDRAIGVLLTGMGVDGAAGLGTMRARGARTIAQDRESSVVWGMPGEAVKRGAAELVLPLDAIGGKLLQLVRQRRAA